MSENELAHEMIRIFYQFYPELFPSRMDLGYMLNGKTQFSKKLELRTWKIKEDEPSFSIIHELLLKKGLILQAYAQTQKLLLLN